MNIAGKITNFSINDKGAKLTLEIVGLTEKGIVESLAKWATYSQDLKINLVEDQAQTKLSKE